MGAALLHGDYGLERGENTLGQNAALPLHRNTGYSSDTGERGWKLHNFAKCFHTPTRCKSNRDTLTLGLDAELQSYLGSVNNCHDQCVHSQWS